MTGVCKQGHRSEDHTSDSFQNNKRDVQPNTDREGARVIDRPMGVAVTASVMMVMSHSRNLTEGLGVDNHSSRHAPRDERDIIDVLR